MTFPFLLNDGTETTYGMGLGLGEVLGRTSVQHGGGIFGFNSFLMYLPEERISVAVISNSEAFSSQNVALRVAALLLGSESAASEASSGR